MIRIKEILKEKGITQIELAEKLGVSHQSIKQTLNASSVTTATLEKIALALNVDMWELFASKQEIYTLTDFENAQKGNARITCPHCGKSLELKIEKHE